MTTPAIPICESCARVGPGPEGGFACAAFPDGIPEEIYPGGFDHRQPFPGDNGVRWELSSEEGAEARLRAYEANRAVISSTDY